MTRRRPLTAVEQYLHDLRGAPIPPEVLALLAPVRAPFLPSAYVMEGGSEAFTRATRRLRKRANAAVGQSAFVRWGRS
jgi:hypothetical protein